VEFACHGIYLMIQNVPPSICQTIALSLKLILSLLFCTRLGCGRLPPFRHEPMPKNPLNLTLPHYLTGKAI
jgi:hypothetical protein